MRAKLAYLLITIALTLLAAACDKGGDSGGSSGSGGGPGGAIVGNTASSSELNLAVQVLALVNQERANNGGLPPLANNTALAQVAYDHSWDMQYRNFFSHTNPGGADPFDRMAAAGISYSYAGENIAMGYATPADVMAGWMASSGHRANILNVNYTEIGIGVREGTGGPWWTQVFRKP
ncbi:hypothetical protein PLCT1_02332 [Planctomycetaceae bacterium]|nr:hypothetical protein PLCT1_02332 [Planctomycetaceae bacterium]